MGGRRGPRLTYENAERWLLASGVPVQVAAEWLFVGWGKDVVRGVQVALSVYSAEDLRIQMMQHGYQPAALEEFLGRRQRFRHIRRPK
jgi:hypothetical protein